MDFILVDEKVPPVYLECIGISIFNQMLDSVDFWVSMNPRPFRSFLETLLNGKEESETAVER